MSRGGAVLSGPAGDGALTLQKWSVADWLANEAAWSRLLGRSNADALFQSWEWLTLWWQCFGDTLAAVPQILAFRRGGELVGVAPLYRRRIVRHRLLPTSSVQLIGLSWRDPAPPISEYLDVVATVDEADAVRHACVRAMQGESAWTEWVIGFTASRPGTLGIAAWVPRLRKTLSPTSVRVPPSFRLTSSVLAPTKRPLPMISSAPLSL